jgi:NAD(P)-dependent dehydrogenase (short-subunit alcohol dehydrogenase family)
MEGFHSMTFNYDSMHGKRCLVTGATDGIGKQTAMTLAKVGADVVVVGRNHAKTEATVNYIQELTGSTNVEFLLADLSSQAEIYQLADDFKRKYARLDVLINNAGAIFIRRKKSIDGIELTFALNHLGYFLLTNLLLDVLKANSPARIINVASGSHYDAEIDFNELKSPQRYRGMQRYGVSKLGNVLFTYELSRRLAGTGVTANAVHPGFVATNMGTNIGWYVRLFKPLINLRAIPVEEGVDTVTSADVENVTGKYFYKRAPRKTSVISYDEDIAQQLWTFSEALTAA